MKKLRNNILIILLFVSVDLSSQSSWDPLGDKKKHMMAGAFFSGMTSFIVYDNNGERKKNAFLWGIASSLIVGTIKELADHNKPENTPWTDLGYNLIGGVIGSVAVNITLNRYENKHERRVRKLRKLLKKQTK